MGVAWGKVMVIDPRDDGAAKTKKKGTILSQ